MYFPLLLWLVFGRLEIQEDFVQICLVGALCGYLDLPVRCELDD